MKKFRDYFTKQVLTWVVSVGAIIMVILYVFVYLKYAQMTQELEASNVRLKNSLIELKEYYDNMDKYVQESNALEESIEEIMKEYPADAREEDIIMLAVNTQKNNKLSYSNINMAEQALVYAVPQNVVTASTIEGYEQEIDFMEKKATYANKTDYSNLKGIIEQIYAAPNRIAINNIAYTKQQDSEVLEGVIDLSFYSAAGTGKEYECPDIAEYVSGTENLFQ